MPTYWIFDDGQLVARNEACMPLCAWPVDEEIGRPFAELLNHAPAISQMLLRHSTDELCESSPRRHTFP